jgi:hypothetical protein
MNSPEKPPIGAGHAEPDFDRHGWNQIAPDPTNAWSPNQGDRSHPCGVIFMKLAPFALAAAAVLTATGASAQSVNLSGAYRCIAGCRADAPAFVTQNGYELNLVNEAGQSSRAWPDAFAPSSRIWADNWNMSAVYSPDAMVIQFDNGTIWHRDMGPPPRSVRVRARRAELK